MAENFETQTENENTNENEGQQTKTYTQEEVDEMLQREGDRRVSEALKKAEKKHTEKLQEAEKLAKMNEQEKYEYQLAEREKAIAEKELQLALAENKATATKVLVEKGLSPTLVDFVVAEDAETMNTNIKALETAFKNSVKAEVEKRLGGKAPKDANKPNDQLTAEDFRKMSIVEQNKLARTDPELYKALSAH